MKTLGIFDSGIGGMTVVDQLHRRCPALPIVYFGDTANTPYGEKSAEQVCGLSLAIGKFLEEQHVSKIVIACGTASISAIDTLKTTCQVPVMGIADSLVKKAAQRSSTGNIALLATSTTVNSRVLEQKIHSLRSEANVYSLACPQFVPLLEEGCMDPKILRQVVRETLAPLSTKIFDTVVLGCTHYPLLNTLIKELLPPNVTLIDVAEVTVDAILSAVEPPIGNPSPYQPLLYVSADPERFHTVCKRLFPSMEIEVKEANAFSPYVLT